MESRSRSARCSTAAPPVRRRRSGASPEASGASSRITTGATVPGATVTVTSLERKTVDTVVSNESGLYVKDRLLPGTYEVKAELAGFKTGGRALRSGSASTHRRRSTSC